MDPIRILALPVLIFSPIVFISIYVVYTFLELLAWIIMKRKDDICIILIYPFYTLFNSIVRFASYPSFVFRRLVYFLLNYPKKKDDYRTNKPSLIILFISFLIVIEMSIFFLFVLPDLLKF